MPRDANGNYTLPAGNPVISGTTIDTTWANPTMNDLAIAITDSLSRTGEGGMLVPFLFPDGAVATPGMSWTNETTTGFYRAGASDMRVSVGAVDKFRWTATSVQVWDIPTLTWVDVATTISLGNYLPLSGGTLTGSGNTLSIRPLAASQQAFIQFQDDLGVSVGGIGRIDALSDDLKIESFVGSVFVDSTAAINLNAPVTNITGDNEFLNLKQATSNAPFWVGFRSATDNLTSYMGHTLASLLDFELTNQTGKMTVQSTTSDVSIISPTNINLNAPVLANGGGGEVAINVVKSAGQDNAYVTFIDESLVSQGLVGILFDTITLRTENASGKKIVIQSAVSINLNAPIVEVNGAPLGGVVEISTSTGGAGTTWVIPCVAFKPIYIIADYAVGDSWKSIRCSAGGITQLQFSRLGGGSAEQDNMPSHTYMPTTASMTISINTISASLTMRAYQ